jgi:hypothetical protein
MRPDQTARPRDEVMTGTLIPKCHAQASAIVLSIDPIAGELSDEPPGRTDRKPPVMTEPCELEEFRENVEDFVNNLREVLDKLSRLMRSGSNNPLLIAECLQEGHRMAFILAGEQDEAVIAGMRGQLEQTIPPAVVESLFSAIRKCKAVIECGGNVSVRRH